MPWQGWTIIALLLLACGALIYMAHVYWTDRETWRGKATFAWDELRQLRHDQRYTPDGYLRRAVDYSAVRDWERN